MKQIYALIHGYGGGSFELECLYRYLMDRGCDVRYIVLDGHETTRADFAKSTMHTWLASAGGALEVCRRQCDELFVIGFSMGGLIAANLYPAVRPDKIVFVNTPVYYWNLKKITKNIVHDIRFRDYGNIQRYVKTSLDKPFSTMVQFQSLLEKSKKCFGSVTCPALVTQCLEDDTVRSKSAYFIYQRLAGEKQLKIYEGGAHQAFESEVAEILCQDIYHFAVGHCNIQ